MIAYIFAGQGSQYPKMGADLYENFDDVKVLFENIPKELREILLSNSELINDTKYSQPAIYLTSYILARKLEQKIKPNYVAGLSLGEYTALSISNVFEFQEVLEIVQRRGVLMSDALLNTNSGMYAVLGGDLAVIESQLIDGVQIANYNCPGQVVLTGYLDKLEVVVDKLKTLGVKRCIKLNVSGAFHSNLLNGASKELRVVLDTYTPKSPTYSVVYNTFGKESNNNVKYILELQIKSSVLFQQSLEYMIERGVTTFIEIGSKNNLSNFVKKINSDLKVYSVYDYESLMKVSDEL